MIVPQWAQTLIELAKLNEKHFYNAKVIVMWGAFFFIVNKMITKSDADCDTNYNKAEKVTNHYVELCKIKDAEISYLSNGKTDCLIMLDQMQNKVFVKNREIDSLKTIIHNLKNK